MILEAALEIASRRKHGLIIDNEKKEKAEKLIKRGKNNKK